MRKIELEFASPEPLKVNGTAVKADAISLEVKPQYSGVSIIREERIKSLRIQGHRYLLGRTNPEPVTLEIVDLEGDGHVITLDGAELDQGTFLASIEMKLTGTDQEAHVRFMSRNESESKILYGTCIIIVSTMTVETK